MTQSNQPKQTKAKQALVEAFKNLVISQPYREIHVADIINAADVSRSTFYEHFANKEEILKHSLQPVIAIWGSAGFETCDVVRLSALVQHFFDIRPLSTIYLESDISQVVSEMLANEILTQLPQTENTGRSALSPNLLANQIANAGIGLVRAWLSSPGEVHARQIAKQMHDGSALLISLLNV